MARKLWIFILFLLLGCNLIKAPRPQRIVPDYQIAIAKTQPPETLEEVYAALQQGRPEDALSAPAALFRDNIIGERLRGVAYSMLGDYDAALNSLMAVRKVTKDEKINAQICEDLVWLALSRGDYNSAARWQADMATLCDIKPDPLMHLWNRLVLEGDSVLTMPDHPVALPLTGRPFPRAAIKVNGNESNFIFDTGAGMTAISASRARAWKLPVIALPDTAHGLGKISVRYTIIAKLELGEVTLTNIPAVVIDDKDLTFTVLGFIKLIDVPGIIGLPVLARMRFTIDTAGKKIILEKSGPAPQGPKLPLIYWRNQMFVPLFLAEMGQLNFFMDTGANRSSLSFDTAKTLPPSAKVDRKTHDLAQGAGGVMKMTGLYHPRWVALDGMFMEGLGLDLESRPREHEGDLLIRDGTLGMDILQCFILTVDIPARFMQVVLPSKLSQAVADG